MKNYTKEQVEYAISSTRSEAEAARFLGCKCPTLEKYAALYGIEVIKNPHHKGYPAHNRSVQTADEAFQKGSKASKGILVYWLKQEREWKCECCGLTEWQGKRLPLEVHHINGDRTDQRRENLQILCPNCHAITENWRSGNLGVHTKRAQRVSDEELLEAVHSELSIAKALQKVGLADGANRYRVRKLLADEYLKSQGKSTKA